MQGVLVLPSYESKLILDKGPQGAISACRKLDIFGYHTWFFFMCHEDRWYAALLSDMHNIHPFLQTAQGFGAKTSVRRPALMIVNSMRGLPHVEPSYIAATRLLNFVAMSTDGGTACDSTTCAPSSRTSWTSLMSTMPRRRRRRAWTAR